jgi:hypothetical protein
VDITHSNKWEDGIVERYWAGEDMSNVDAKTEKTDKKKDTKKSGGMCTNDSSSSFEKKKNTYVVKPNEPPQQGGELMTPIPLRNVLRVWI